MLHEHRHGTGCVVEIRHCRIGIHGCRYPKSRGSLGRGCTTSIVILPSLRHATRACNSPRLIRNGSARLCSRRAKRHDGQWQTGKSLVTAIASCELANNQYHAIHPQLCRCDADQRYLVLQAVGQGIASTGIILLFEASIFHMSWSSVLLNSADCVVAQLPTPSNVRPQDNDETDFSKKSTKSLSVEYLEAPSRS